MAIERWSEEEIRILTSNFDSTRGEVQELLEDAGYLRTIQAIKTKKRDLRAKGEMPAYGASSVTASDRTAGSYAEEITSSDGKTYDCVGDAGSAGEGFFPSAKKTEIYGEYKSMLQELIKDAKAETGFVADDSPVDSENEALVVMISDTHIGKHVVDEDGNSIYNIEIALDRIEQIGAGIKRIISHTKRSTTMDEIVVCLIGDVLDGTEIYKGQAYHQDAHLASQLKAGTKALWDLIVEMSNIDGIKKVRVATVRGNHGRASDTSHEDSNYDNLLYDNLEFASILHGDPKISVETKYSAFHTVTVKGRRLLLRHEAPLTCDTPAARAKLGGWCDMHGKDGRIDAILSGHYHHLQVSTFAGRYIMRNGSTVGKDNLSERMGVSSEIEQICFGINSKRLPTFLYPITLE